MNKKFLKGITALFAVAVLGVSCSSNSNPNGDGATKTKVTKATLESAIKTLGDVVLTTKAGSKEGKFVFGTESFESGTYKVIVPGVSNGSNDPTTGSNNDEFVRSAAVTKIQQVFATKTNELAKLGLKIQNAKITLASQNSNAKKAVINVEFEINDSSKYEFAEGVTGSTIIELDVTANIGVAVTFVVS